MAHATSSEYRRAGHRTSQSIRPRSIRPWSVGACFALAVAALAPNVALSDEAGVSFWLPGQFGSMAATPAQPGWSFASIFYHSGVIAGGDKVFPRGGRLEAGLNGRPDLVFGNATYVFASPVFGAQAALGLTGAFGVMRAGIDATVTGPMGNVISGSRTDTLFGLADLYPMATLKWNHGVNNFMTYLTGDIPVGSYDVNRIANIGIGHGAIDGGVGYTYFDPHAGYEFSMVTGFTYNFKNTSTDYQNGVDWHLDWGASKFLSKQVHAGLVGYFYQQVTGDSGSGATLGPFKSRVIGIGPQIGFLFPVGDMHGYLNMKAYREFAAENRPEGYSVWLTFAVSMAPHEPSPQRRPMAAR